jgi:hypothetical protein
LQSIRQDKKLLCGCVYRFQGPLSIVFSPWTARFPRPEASLGKACRAGNRGGQRFGNHSKAQEWQPEGLDFGSGARLPGYLNGVRRPGLSPIPPFARKKRRFLKKMSEILIKLEKKLLLFACSRTSYTEPINGKGR